MIKMFINVHVDNIISIEINMIIIMFVVILISKFNAGITNLDVSHSQPHYYII